MFSPRDDEEEMPDALDLQEGDDQVIDNMEQANAANYPDAVRGITDDDVANNGVEGGQAAGKEGEQIKEGFEVNKFKHITNAFDWDPKTGEPMKTVGPRPEVALERGEPEFKPMEVDCKPSTKDNPFGNALPYDTIERQVNQVCPNEFKKDENFYQGLFNSVDDLFDRNNSQRQFTTNPASTRTNDREAAMQFFYNTPYTEH